MKAVATWIKSRLNSKAQNERKRILGFQRFSHTIIIVFVLFLFLFWISETRTNLQTTKNKILRRKIWRNPKKKQKRKISHRQSLRRSFLTASRLGGIQRPQSSCKGELSLASWSRLCVQQKWERDQNTYSQNTNSVDSLVIDFTVSHF